MRKTPRFIFHIVMALRPVPPIRVADAETQHRLLSLRQYSLPKAQLKTGAFIPEFNKMHSQSIQKLSKNGSLRARGPLWVFQDVAQGDFFHTCGCALGTPGESEGPTWLHFGSPRVSFWRFFGTFRCHLGDLGQPRKLRYSCENSTI